MEHITNWIAENKEWLFGGIGISIFSGCGYLINKFVFKNEDKKEDKIVRSQVNNQNVTINVAQPSTTSNTSNPEKKENTTILTIDGIKAQTNILFIDDDKKFKIVSILRKAGWKNTSFFPNPNVTDINAEKIRNAHIIFVDIKGVGTTMYNNEGLDLVVDLKKKYPEKKVVMYSSVQEHSLFHEAINMADDRISKNSQPAIFASAIEKLSEDIWKNV